MGDGGVFWPMGDDPGLGDDVVSPGDDDIDLGGSTNPFPERAAGGLTCGAVSFSEVTVVGDNGEVDRGAPAISRLLRTAA